MHFRRATEIVLALLFTAKTPAFAALLDGEVFPLTEMICVLAVWFSSLRLTLEGPARVPK